MTRTGTSRSRGSAAIRRRTSKPSMPGITRSKGSAARRSGASEPWATSARTWPRLPTAMASLRCSVGLSSTIRMRPRAVSIGRRAPASPAARPRPDGRRRAVEGALAGLGLQRLADRGPLGDAEVARRGLQRVGRASHAVGVPGGGGRIEGGGQLRPLIQKALDQHLRRLPVAAHDVGQRVDRGPVERGRRLGLGLGLVGEAQGLDQRIDADGLADMAVHSGGEEALPVALHRVGGDGDDDGPLVGGPVLADVPGGLPPVHLGPLDFHQHDVVGLASERLRHLEPVARDVGAVAQAHQHDEGELLVRRVVVCEQDAQGEGLREGCVVGRPAVAAVAVDPHGRAGERGQQRAHHGRGLHGLRQHRVEARRPEPLRVVIGPGADGAEEDERQPSGLRPAAQPQRQVDPVDPRHVHVEDRGVEARAVPGEPHGHQRVEHRRGAHRPALRQPNQALEVRGVVVDDQHPLDREVGGGGLHRAPGGVGRDGRLDGEGEDGALALPARHLDLAAGQRHEPL